MPHLLPVSFAIRDIIDEILREPLMRIPAILLLIVTVAGCGGGGNGGGGGPNGGGFTIASGNWMIPLSNTLDLGTPPPAGPFAGGVLTQSGSTISGILHVTGSPCFDPVNDALIVQGSVSASGANPLTLTTAPVRGQALTVSATWDNGLNPGSPPTSPPNPVNNLIGSWAITGGPCAATSSSGFASTFHTTNFNGSWGNSDWTASLSQTAPDAQGFSQLSGTLTLKGSSCFSTGTLATTTFAGDISQMTVTTDTGQLTGSAQGTRGLIAGATFPTITFDFIVHGGPCDGQTLATHVCTSDTASFCL